MHRLPLFLCVLALLGSATSALLFFRIGNSKQVLAQRLDDATTRAAKLDSDLAAAYELTGSLKARVGALQIEIDGTRTKLAAAEGRSQQLVINLQQTREVLGLYETTSRALADEVGLLRQDLAATRSSHASPEAISAYKNTIAELERQLAATRNGAALPSAAGASTAVFTNRAGRATVLTVGPESAFVVLNFGSSRGAELGQKLSVSQGTAEVATVLISDVRPNFSVAQVLPDTLRAALQKGDSAVLLR